MNRDGKRRKPLEQRILFESLCFLSGIIIIFVVSSTATRIERSIVDRLVFGNYNNKSEAFCFDSRFLSVSFYCTASGLVGMKAGKMCEIATNVFAYAFGRDE